MWLCWFYFAWEQVLCKKTLKVAKYLLKRGKKQTKTTTWWSSVLRLEPWSSAEWVGLGARGSPCVSQQVREPLGLHQPLELSPRSFLSGLGLNPFWGGLTQVTELVWEQRKGAREICSGVLPGNSSPSRGGRKAAGDGMGTGVSAGTGLGETVPLLLFPFSCPPLPVPLLLSCGAFTYFWSPERTRQRDLVLTRSNVTRYDLVSLLL